MYFYLITCFSFILFYKLSLPLKALPSWASEMRLLSLCFLKDLLILFPNPKYLNNMPEKPKSIVPIEYLEMGQEENMSVLDLPELVLECILEKLPPDGLCRMACVCTSLRDRCMSDHLWEKHMNKKWSRVIGSAAIREWKSLVASSKDLNFLIDGGKGRGLMGFLSSLLPVLLVNSGFNNSHNNKGSKKNVPLQPADSIVSCYRALETGKFWFPAQVYNRENGHVGFMLSCYDAELSYDPQNNTFHARYPPHGRRAIAMESGVTWDRVRAPPVETSPHDLHVSDCLSDLSPNDHIEIQWRRNKQFPYGWWYGVVGHLETCDGNDRTCRCRQSDIVVLEFNQYNPGSRWRVTTINRKTHREEGNETDGFYGGIRKISRKEEISTWKQFWPAEVLE